MDPFRFNFHFARAAAYRQIHRFEEALAEIEAGRNAGPGVSWAIRMEAGTYELMGNHPAALQAARRWRAHYPDLTAENARISLPKWHHERKYIEGLYRLIDEVWAEDPG